MRKITKLQVELNCLGDNWKFLTSSNGFKRTDVQTNVFIRRASKLNNQMFSVFTDGKFISTHRSISKAKEVADGLV